MLTTHKAAVGKEAYTGLPTPAGPSECLFGLWQGSLLQLGPFAAMLGVTEGVQCARAERRPLLVRGSPALPGS